MGSRVPLRRESLFVYGVLTRPELLFALTRRRWSPVCATLQGYRRTGLALPHWLPLAAVLSDAESHVDGRLLRGVDAASLALLDAFENVHEGLYRREPVEVDLSDGRRVEAQVYLPGPALDGAPFVDWGPDLFMRRHYRDFRDRIIPAFRRRYSPGP